MYDGVRVDVKDSLFGHIHLVLPHGFPRCEDLAVDVCEADLIVVDQIQRADAAARQSLRRIAAHAADPKHGHTGMIQLFHGLRAEEKLRS